MTSIIMVAFDKTDKDRQITAACLGNIEKYTDPNEYELILIDQEPIGTFEPERDRLPSGQFHFSTIDKYIVLDKNIGLSAANNLGASKAIGEYICFIHNDVFVPPNWLPRLKYLLDNGAGGIIAPHQGIADYEFYKWSSLPIEEVSKKGNYDAGLLLMTMEDFNKSGKWDEDFWAVYPGHVFVDYRWRSAGLHCTAGVTITHLGKLSYPPEYKEFEERENILLHERYH